MKKKLKIIGMFIILMTMLAGCTSCKPDANPPTVVLKPATEITKTTAVLSADVNPNGASTSIAFELKGSDNIWITKPVSGSFNGRDKTEVSHNLTGLVPNTQYSFRVKASNGEGEAISNINYFTTNPLDLPAVSLKQATNIGKRTATIAAELRPKMDGTTISFELKGPDNIWITKPVSGTFNGNEVVTVSLDLTDLIPDTQYGFRVRANNSEGEVISDINHFTTNALTPPVVVIKEAASVTKTTATLKAAVIPNLEGTTISFELKDSNNTWTTKAVSGSFSGRDSIQIALDVSGLTPNMKYALIAKAANDDGVTVSDTSYFQAYAVSDYDGNLYHTVTIGEQVWLKENLKATHYANGDPIARETNLDVWMSTNTGIYTYYNNDPELGEIYGALYNYYVGVDPRGLIPGYHAPSDDEFFALARFIRIDGPPSIPLGNDLCEAGDDYWVEVLSYYPKRTDRFGFRALPNGVITRVYPHNVFTNLGEMATFWGSTSLSPNSVHFVDISVPLFHMVYWGYGDPNIGLGIRLIKD